jgi:hypothetical protein
LFGHLMRFITWQATNWKKETISCEENWVTTFKHLNEQNIPLPNLVTVTVCLLFAWNTSTCRTCVLNYEQWLVTWHNWLDESTDPALHCCRLNCHLKCKKFHEQVLLLQLLLRDDITQGVPCTAIISDLLCIPVWVLIISDSSTRALAITNRCTSLVSIVSDYGMKDSAIEVRSPQRQEDFSSSLTGSGAHPGYQGSFPGSKVRPGSEADHSPPSLAEFVNEQ